MTDVRVQLGKVLMGYGEAHPVLTKLRKHVGQSQSGEALELIDVDEKSATLVDGVSARLKAASPMVVTSKPPKREELSSPIWPLARQAPAGTYNAVDDEPLRRREYFDSLAEALGLPPPKIPPHWLALLARSQRVSNRKLRVETGWAPKYPSVREGWVATLQEWQARNAVATARLS
jgi:hypothetical protein